MLFRSLGIIRCFFPGTLNISIGPFTDGRVDKPMRPEEPCNKTYNNTCKTRECNLFLSGPRSKDDPWSWQFLAIHLSIFVPCFSQVGSKWWKLRTHPARTWPDRLRPLWFRGLLRSATDATRAGAKVEASCKVCTLIMIIINNYDRIIWNYDIIVYMAL